MFKIHRQFIYHPVSLDIFCEQTETKDFAFD